MTLAEIEQAKPLHLKVVKVAPGDTVEKLASRMAVPDRQVERFRVLNGLDPGDKLKPGQRGQDRGGIGLTLFEIWSTSGEIGRFLLFRRFGLRYDPLKAEWPRRGKRMRF